MQFLRPPGSPIRQQGFSFSEVIATLGVLGVSLSLVVPSLSSMTSSNLRATSINELVATLHVARNEAITLNEVIVICPSQDGETCAPVAWESGWIRFADTNGDFAAGPGERVLGSRAPLTGLQIRSDAFGKAFGYLPSGRVSSPDQGLSGGEFRFCPASGPADARVLAVSALGYTVLAERHADGQEPDCPMA